MKENDKDQIPNQRKIGSRGVIRLLSALLGVLFVFSAFVGYVSYESGKKIEELGKNLDEASAEIAALKDGGVEMQEEIEVLKADKVTAEEKIGALEEYNSKAQEEIDALKQSELSAKQEIESLQSVGDAAKAEIEAAESEIASLKDGNEALKSELDEMKSENTAAQEEIEQLKARIEELERASDGKIRIYIDQGHNPTSYHNSGAVGNGLYEQDLTFTIGLLLASLLEADGRFEVCLSRPAADTVLGTDNTSSLEARVQGAKDFDADYFISLHINAFSDANVNGIEVYAAEQNSTSYAFGNCLLEGMVASTELRNRGMKINPELRVLKNATMPAVLLEMGFISSSKDAELLAESPDLFARGIYNGIVSYFIENVA